MNEKQMKIVIVAIIAVMVIITIILISISKLKSVNSNEGIKDSGKADLEVIEEAQLITNQRLYFTIRDDILQKYLKAVEKNDSEAVYNMLNDEYKKENNINVSNVIQKSSSYKIPKAFPIHIYQKELTNFTVFYIDTIVQNNEIVNNTELKVIPQEEFYKIIIDIENNAFSIAKINEDYYNSGIKAKENIKNNIIQNEDNIVKYVNITEKSLVTEYMLNYSNMLENNPERAYELLDDDYKKTKFNDYQAFENLIKQGIANGMEPDTYSKEYDENGNVKYICKNVYGITITFKETAIMEYTVELDDYTIESKEFTQKYENSKNQDKGIINIDKFFEMINMQDYTSAYNLLDESFKETYFKTQADFENFVKQYMFRYNKVKYKTYSDQIGSLLIYGITLTDSTKESDKEVNCNIIMKLLEDTNFVMSFEITQ